MTLLAAITPGARELISIVGGGGKTTTMFALALALKGRGRKVCVTTTTHIRFPEQGQCDYIFFSALPSLHELAEIPSQSLSCLAAGLDSRTSKIKGLEPQVINALFEQKAFDYILVEADGSRGRSMKAPAEHEPVIPLQTSICIGVVGLDALGAVMDETTVHRPEILSKITLSGQSDVITAQDIQALINSPKGLFKNAPQGCRRIAFLNKVDQMPVSDSLEFLSEKLKKESRGVECVIGSARYNRAVLC